MMERREIRNAMAKAIADKIGHGMAEKHFAHADAVLDWMEGNDLWLIRTHPTAGPAEPDRPIRSKSWPR